jgi:two-component system NarL family sensor kinase
LAQVTIGNHENRLVISVKDNRKGVSSTALSNGIGLSNTDSKIRFLEDDIQRESNENGIVFNKIINRKKNI